MRSRLDSINLSDAEAHFRLMAFRISYDHMFAHVGDLMTRFACAIAYSAREIADQNLLQAWCEWSRGRRITDLLQSGSEPPAELRPFVETFLRVTRERTKETGDLIEDVI